MLPNPFLLLLMKALRSTNRVGWTRGSHEVVVALKLMDTHTVTLPGMPSIRQYVTQLVGKREWLSACRNKNVVQKLRSCWIGILSERKPRYWRPKIMRFLAVKDMDVLE